MDIDGETTVLDMAAAGEAFELDLWPALQIEILSRLDKIAHTEFPIPNLPPPRQPRRSLDNGAPASSSPTAEPSSQEADKENAPVHINGERNDGGKNAEETDDRPTESTPTRDGKDIVMGRTDEVSTETPNGEATDQAGAQPETATGNPSSEPTAAHGSNLSNSVPKLPIQITDMLDDIKDQIRTFTNAPPHTLQRLAELILYPKAHYRALATYLHAVDRVVRVTSGLNTYPLPPATIPDMSSMNMNGTDSDKNPADSIGWGNTTTGVEGSNRSNQAAPVPVGSDEALGGALLTPIPWLTRRSPESGDGASTSSGGGSTGGGSSGGAGAQIHSEGIETIDGPNGMGSIETVSVSVNGVSSTGHARGVTQGELLRQEQRAGVVPVSQLSRNAGHPQQHAIQQHQLQSQRAHGDGSDEDEDDEHQSMEEDRPAPAADEGEEEDGEEEEEEEIPHARGPEEIGVGDTGPQTATTSSIGEGGLEMQGIDVAAAVGRPREQEEHPEPQRQTPEEDEKDGEGATATAKDGGEQPLSPEEGTGTKREAEDAAEGEPAKKLKED